MPKVMTKAKGKMTMAEAGQKGGRKVKRERGMAYYSEIGRKGSKARWGTTTAKKLAVKKKK
ncbi:MAG: hypothetical protein M1150_00180 [Patescibacteria group bacterium]|nr:hypothetical protein [Patescibacteria group bacterium]